MASSDPSVSVNFFVITTLHPFLPSNFTVRFYLTMKSTTSVSVFTPNNCSNHGSAFVFFNGTAISLIVTHLSSSTPVCNEAATAPAISFGAAAHSLIALHFLVTFSPITIFSNTLCTPIRHVISLSVVLSKEALHEIYSSLLQYWPLPVSTTSTVFFARLRSSF